MSAKQPRTFRISDRIRIFNKHVTNRLLRVFVHLPRGPFALIRHAGRKSGKTYETVIWVWPLHEDFVIALTYGPGVDWYRNMRAAGGGTIVWRKKAYAVGKPELVELNTISPAFPAFFRFLFRRAGLRDFALLKSSGSEAARA